MWRKCNICEVCRCLAGLKKKTKNCCVQLKQTQNPAFCFVLSCSKNPSPKDGAATPGTPKVRGTSHTPGCHHLVVTERDIWNIFVYFQLTLRWNTLTRTSLQLQNNSICSHTPGVPDPGASLRSQSRSGTAVVTAHLPAVV